MKKIKNIISKYTENINLKRIPTKEFYIIPSIKWFYEKEGGNFHNGRYLNNGFQGYHLNIKFIKWVLQYGENKKI